MSVTICCDCAPYGGGATGAAQCAGRFAHTKKPCNCDCHKATHETVSLPEGRLEWLERCEKAIRMAARVAAETPEELVSYCLNDVPEEEPE